MVVVDGSLEFVVTFDEDELELAAVVLEADELVGEVLVEVEELGCNVVVLRVEELEVTVAVFVVEEVDVETISEVFVDTGELDVAGSVPEVLVEVVVEVVLSGSLVVDVLVFSVEELVAILGFDVEELVAGVVEVEDDVFGVEALVTTVVVCEVEAPVETVFDVEGFDVEELEVTGLLVVNDFELVVVLACGFEVLVETGVVFDVDDVVELVVT